MTVDFHTHVFPDRVARGAIASLASASGGVAYSDGTVAGLRAAISAAGVTVAVNLPVLTSPTQFESVLAYAEALKKTPLLVTMMMVNNETGAVYDVARAFDMAKKNSRETVTHCDAVQGFLKCRELTMTLKFLWKK